MMTLTLLNQIQSHVTLSQHETTEFIQYLINPECHTQDKVKLLQAFTNKSIQQKELEETLLKAKSLLEVTP